MSAEQTVTERYGNADALARDGWSPDLSKDITDMFAEIAELRSFRDAVLTAVGWDPSTPLANVVVLHPGQHVVEHHGQVPEGMRFLSDFDTAPKPASEGHDFMRWVVVTSGPEVTG